MDAQQAAERWARTWERAWPAKDSDAIAALYADGAAYRSHAFRDPEPGGALAYTRREFGVEQQITCRIGRPIAAADRAAVEWWASWGEDASTSTRAGATVLRFDADGKVVDHVDYWLQSEGRREPYPGWGGSR